ncbi:phage protease [Pseudomonas sp. NY15435]|uniref:phage protease n=1 Tax=Pseudomonas sp. NY15435 TaxID=3400358 RepID=UPI003A8BB89C
MKKPTLQSSLATALCFELGTDVPEWVEVLPPGPNVTGRDGRKWTYDANQVIAETVAHTQGADLPFDYEHATELKAPKGEKAEASGWAREYRINERGALEARVEWTKEARNAIEARQYRYISPVFAYDDRTGHIYRFSSFGLVNKPNLVTKALNSEQAPSLSQQPEESDMALAAILAALGLPETATEEEAVAAINKLLEDKKVALQTAANSETRVPSLDLYVPRQDYNNLEKRALNAEQKLDQQAKTQLATAINAEIEDALKAGKITPATKDYHLAACQEAGGLERFRQFVAAAPSVTDPVAPDGERRTEKTALNSEEQAAARQFGWTDEQYLEKTKGIK